MAGQDTTDRPIDAELRGAVLQGKRTRDIELPNQSRTIDPRLPDAPRRQYQMDVRDLETPKSMDPATRRMRLKRMNGYLATPRSMGGGGR